MNLMDSVVISDWLADANLWSIGAAFAIALLLVIIPLRLDHGELTVISWPAFGLSQVLIGHAVLDEFFFADAFWPTFAVGAFALVAGYYLVSKRPLPPRAVGSPTQPEAVTKAFALVISAFVAYHFIVGGVPLLAADVETERFNFTSSGLMGVPGRMYMFGLPFLVVYVAYAVMRNPSSGLTRLHRFVWIEYVATMILSGFKGSLILVLLQWLLVRSMMGQPVKLRTLARPRYAALLLGPVLFGGIVAQFYGTLDLKGNSGTAVYLAQRTTVIAASAGAIAVRADYGGHSGLYVADDAAYIIRKYFGIQLINHEIFPLEKVISSQLTGTPLEDDEFNVPITVGGFVSLVVDFGVAASVVLLLLLGAAYAALRRRGERARSPFEFATLGLTIQMIYTFVVNGNLAYCAINTGLMLIMLFFIHVVCIRVASNTLATRGVS